MTAGITYIAEKQFDGEVLSCDLAGIISGALRDGDIMSVKGGSFITYVGTVPNVCGGIVITDKYGNDVTRDYIITVYAGELKVLQTGLPVKNTGITIPVDGSCYLGAIELSDKVGAFPMRFRFVPGSGKAGIVGKRLDGIEIGDGKLTVMHDPIDVNGDGTPEYFGGSVDLPVDIVGSKKPFPTGAVCIAAGVPLIAAGLALVLFRRPIRVRMRSGRRRRRR